MNEIVDPGRFPDVDFSVTAGFIAVFSDVLGMHYLGLRIVLCLELKPRDMIEPR